ncbi:sugar ABC transporter permease [Microbacterium sp. ET2]|uniref:sugar ABC transporter permease n=1 Tax=Microbacterium albipurpureum TaxID=3050384 RepID=UPI00259D0095|nr:sugar ABC transporter permease [Microbacterium sp. ET2 (Ac-2212)]WJL96412.1 sugar ABC transporter permease [Microbacterium sp. ET2 (Ac-2212)]
MALNSNPLTSQPAPALAEALADDRRGAAAAEKAAPAPRRPFGRWFRETGWRHIIGIVMLLFCAFPLAYVLSASLNPGGTLLTANSLFSTFDLGAYFRLFENPSQPYGAWFVNTLVIGLATAFGTVLLGALAAYAFSRMRFTGRRFGLLTLLLVQMFPQLLAFVAIFLLMSAIADIFPALGLNSQLGLIMVYLGGALGVNTYLMYGFFNTVPASIDEAAKIDGAGHARIFFTIILRLVAPILAVVGLLSFLATTNDFVIASVVLSDPDKQTLAVGLYQFVSQETARNWSVFAAGAVLAAIIPVALFLALQRFIVGGLTAGSVK